MDNLELKLLEEINKLQNYAVKTAVDKRNFWSEWQHIYTKVKLNKIAIKSLLDDDNLSSEEKKKLKSKLNTLREIEYYLKELKDVALQVKGYSIFTTEESEDDDDIIF
jgi:hypothetical protein